MYRHIALLSLSLVPLAAGCTLDDADLIGASPLDAYILSGNIWTTSEIPVCWENPSSGDATERGWVETAIASTWEAVADVRFTGWGTCSSGASGIRILIDDQGPSVKKLGNALDGVINGMDLNFTFQNWGCSNSSGNQIPCSFPFAGLSRQDFIEYIAVHEFGHVLSFAHEQNRPDTPSWCDDVQGTNGDWTIGSWDEDSVMNYCNGDWNNNGQLSDDDVKAARYVYGHARTVAFRSSGGKYFRAVAGGGGDIRADRTNIDKHEQFRLVSLGSGWYAIRTATGHYLRAHVGGGSYLKADVTHIGSHERFKLVDAGGGKYALQTHYGYYLVAENGGNDIVNANRTAIGTWEKFDFVDLEGSPVALETANGHYVVAIGRGDGDVKADRTSAGPWTILDLVELPGGQVALRAPDGHYLSARTNGDLNATANYIGDYERFSLINAGSGKYGFKSYHNTYIVAEGGGGGDANANRTSLGSWEKFEILYQ